MAQTTAQLLAALMTVIHGVTWVVISRWERPGRTARMRVRLRPPDPIGWGGDVAQVVPLVYPVLVVAVPRWAYEGPLSWSFSTDVAAQSVGLGIWAAGVWVVLWAGWVLGPYMSVNGLAVGHELVTSGPYRFIRHPVYTSSTAIAMGTALVFRSYLLVVVAISWIAASLWWAEAEERLMTSPEGFGEAYRTYAGTTGRFLPRLRLR